MPYDVLGRGTEAVRNTTPNYRILVAFLACFIVLIHSCTGMKSAANDASQTLPFSYVLLVISIAGAGLVYSLSQQKYHSRESEIAQLESILEADALEPTESELKELEGEIKSGEGIGKEIAERLEVLDTEHGGQAQDYDFRREYLEIPGEDKEFLGWDVILEGGRTRYHLKLKDRTLTIYRSQPDQEIAERGRFLISFKGGEPDENWAQQIATQIRSHEGVHCIQIRGQTRCKHPANTKEANEWIAAYLTREVRTSASLLLVATRRSWLTPWVGLEYRTGVDHCDRVLLLWLEGEDPTEKFVPLNPWLSCLLPAASVEVVKKAHGQTLEEFADELCHKCVKEEDSHSLALTLETFFRFAGWAFVLAGWWYNNLTMAVIGCVIYAISWLRFEKPIGKIVFWGISKKKYLGLTTLIYLTWVLSSPDFFPGLTDFVEEALTPPIIEPYSFDPNDLYDTPSPEPSTTEPVASPFKWSGLILTPIVRVVPVKLGSWLRNALLKRAFPNPEL